MAISFWCIDLSSGARSRLDPFNWGGGQRSQKGFDSTLKFCLSIGVTLLTLSIDVRTLELVSSNWFCLAAPVPDLIDSAIPHLSALSNRSLAPPTLSVHTVKSGSGAADPI